MVREKKNEKKVIFGTIPAVAAAQTTTEAPATASEAPEAKPEMKVPALAPAEETPFEEMFPDAPKVQAETVLKLSQRIEELEQQLRQDPQTIEERSRPSPSVTNISSRRWSTSINWCRG